MRAPRGLLHDAVLPYTYTHFSHCHHPGEDSLPSLCHPLLLHHFFWTSIIFGLQLNYMQIHDCLVCLLLRCLNFACANCALLMCSSDAPLLPRIAAPTRLREVGGPGWMMRRLGGSDALPTALAPKLLKTAAASRHVSEHGEARGVAQHVNFRATNATYYCVTATPHAGGACGAGWGRCW